MSNPRQTPATGPRQAGAKPRLNSAGEQVFSRAEVENLWGVAGTTLRRDVAAGKHPHAYKETIGKVEHWRYTASDLVAAGYTYTAADTPGPRQAPAKAAPSGPRQAPATDDRAAALEAELAAMREQLQAERERRLVAEARFDAARDLTEAHKQRADEAVRAMLMIGAGTPRPDHLSHSSQPTTPGDVINPDGHEPEADHQTVEPVEPGHEHGVGLLDRLLNRRR